MILKTINLIKILFTKKKGESSVSERRYRNAALATLAMGFSRFANIISGLVMIPLALNYLGKEKFGLWMTINSTLVLIQYLDLGIGNSLMNKISEAFANNDKQGIRIIISNGITLMLFLSLVVIGVFFILDQFLLWHHVFNVKSEDIFSETRLTCMVIAFIISLNVALNFILRINNALQEGYINGLWQSIGIMLGLVLFVMAVRLRYSMPVLVLFYMAGPVFAILGNGIFSFYKRKAWAKPEIKLIKPEVMKRIALLGTWFFLFQMITSFNNAIPNLVIAHLVGLEQVTYFAVAFRLASIAVILQTVILHPLWPAYSEAKEKGDWKWIKNALHNSLKLNAMISLVMACMVIFWGRELIGFWIQDSVIPESGILWGMGFWIFLNSIFGPFSIFLNGIGEIKIQVLYGAILTVLLLIFSILSASQFGLIGVSWAFGIIFPLPAVFIFGWKALRIIKLNLR